MYRVLVFLACLAVGFGKNSSTNVIVQPTTTVAPNNSTTSQTTTLPISTSSVMSLSISMSTAMVMSSSSPMVAPTPTPSLTPTPKPSVSTTTPKPTTKTTTAPPKPTKGDYSVKDKPNGTYCLLANLIVSFNVSYMRNTTEKKGNKTIFHIVKEFVSVNMPFEDFSTDGSKCGTHNSMLKVSWPKNDSSYFFMMSFGKMKVNNATSGWEVTAVALNVSTKNNTKFKNANETTLMFYSGNETELGYLSGNINGSYKCGLNKTYPFSGNNGRMTITFAQLQPFDVPSSKGKEDFGAETNCEKPGPKKDKNSNIVPIAVGCALAGLVLIVLIAYIIGRRKSQRGYEKV